MEKAVVDPVPQRRDADDTARFLAGLPGKPGSPYQELEASPAWQEHRQFVSTTRWWPPFCATVDFLVAAILIIEIAAGVNFHQ